VSCDVRPVDGGMIVVSGKDADPQESLWDFKRSRTPPGAASARRNGSDVAWRGTSIRA
jgi:hypothetical protein